MCKTLNYHFHTLKGWKSHRFTLFRALRPFIFWKLYRRARHHYPWFCHMNIYKPSQLDRIYSASYNVAHMGLTYIHLTICRVLNWITWWGVIHIKLPSLNHPLLDFNWILRITILVPKPLHDILLVNYDFLFVFNFRLKAACHLISMWSRIHVSSFTHKMIQEIWICVLGLTTM